MQDPERQLLDAAESGDLDGLRAALYADTDRQADRGKALAWAAENGHQEVVRFMLTAGADVHWNTDAPLRYAAEEGHLEVVECLLAAGASVSADESAPLQWAADNGHLPVVQCLIAAGADIHAKNHLALHLAASSGHPDIVALLLQCAPQWTGLVPTLHEYPPSVQLIFMRLDDAVSLPLIDLARQGVCQEALCVFLERHGHGELAAMLVATNMLDNLTPDARAELLEDLLAQTQARSPCYA